MGCLFMRSSKEKQLLDIIISDLNEIDSDFLRFGGYNYNTFMQDKTLQRSVIMSLITICESVFTLSQIFRNNYPNVNWKLLKNLRNIAAHKYGAINFMIVW